MPDMRIDLAALASYVEATLDCSSEHEDDAFTFDFQGERIYCERHRRYFRLEIAEEQIQLPRF